MKRLTFYGIDDEEEPVPIKDAKRVCCNVCVGSSFRYDDSSDEEDIISDKRANYDIEVKIFFIL